VLTADTVIYNRAFPSQLLHAFDRFHSMQSSYDINSRNVFRKLPLSEKKSAPFATAIAKRQ